MGHLLALGLSGVVAFAFYSTVRLALGNVRWVITLSLQYWTFTSLSETHWGCLLNRGYRCYSLGRVRRRSSLVGLGIINSREKFF